MPNGGAAWSHTFPLHEPPDALVSTRCARRSLTRHLLRSSKERLLVALAPPRLPALAQSVYHSTSGSSAWMAPGSGCTPLCASECAFSPPEEPPEQPSAAIEWTEPVGQEYRGV